MVKLLINPLILFLEGFLLWKKEVQSTLLQKETRMQHPRSTDAFKSDHSKTPTKQAAPIAQPLKNPKAMQKRFQTTILLFQKSLHQSKHLGGKEEEKKHTPTYKKHKTNNLRELTKKMPKNTTNDKHHLFFQLHFSFHHGTDALPGLQRLWPPPAKLPKRRLGVGDAPKGRHLGGQMQKNRCLSRSLEENERQKVAKKEGGRYT